MNQGNIDEFRKLIQSLVKDSPSCQYKEYVLEYTEEHPLKDVLNCSSSQPVILASKFVDAPDTDVEEKATDEDVSVEHIEMEGSPLRLQEFRVETSRDIRTTPHGHVSRPLTCNEARRLLSLYTVGAHGDVGDQGKPPTPLWAMCTGQDKESVVYLASSVTTDTESRAHVKTYNVTSIGPVSTDAKLPKLNTVMKQHIRNTNSNVHMKCSSQYDIFGSQSKDSTILGYQGSLQINLSWEKVSSLLQNPPLDAKSIVNAVVVAGDMRSMAHYMYAELAILQSFAQGLTDGLVRWALEEHGVTLLDRVKLLVEDLKLGDAVREQKEENKDEELLSPLKNLVLIERKDLDFTEQLWNILKDCSSYSGLIASLQFVLQCLQSGELQPMVHKTNHSSLAHLVRDAYYSKMEMPQLDGLSPLLMLVEIGIEKLRRDYSNAFIGKDLVTASHLQYFVVSEGEVSERVARLEKLHHALELVVMLEQFLSLPRVSLSISARHALKHYENQSVQDHHVFSIPIQTVSIAGHVESCQPSLWRAELTSEVDGQMVHSVCLFTSKSIYSHVGDDRTAEQENASKALYYFTMLTEQLISL